MLFDIFLKWIPWVVGFTALACITGFFVGFGIDQVKRRMWQKVLRKNSSGK